MDEEFWNKHKDEQGRIVGVGEVKKVIFRGVSGPDKFKNAALFVLCVTSKLHFRVFQT